MAKAWKHENLEAWLFNQSVGHPIPKGEAHGNTEVGKLRKWWCHDLSQDTWRLQWLNTSHMPLLIPWHVPWSLTWCHNSHAMGPWPKPRHMMHATTPMPWCHNPSQDMWHGAMARAKTCDACRLMPWHVPQSLTWCHDACQETWRLPLSMPWCVP